MSRVVLRGVLSFVLFGFGVVEGYTRPSHISPEAWAAAAPYFLPEDHPVKGKLDRLFGTRRVTASRRTMRAAGFEGVVAQKWTRVIVASHPSVPGYLFKLYTDSQHPHRGLPEHVFWIWRIQGARMIAQRIKELAAGDRFTVPKKWIYPLPASPRPLVRGWIKGFILVVERMAILPAGVNEAAWGDRRRVTPELLDTLAYIVQPLGLNDGAKPANSPFIEDGRVAFVDTQSFHVWPVGYRKLSMFLPPELVPGWEAHFAEG